MSRNITTRTTIENLTAELKKKFAAQTTEIDSAFKGVAITDSKISFYTTTDTTGTAAASIDLPVDMVLDLTSTKMVDSFAFSTDTYPGATDPNLDGKPVLVMAITTGSGTSYSFLSMEELVDVYVAVAGNGSTTVTIDGYTVAVNVNISTESDNQLSLKDDGLYVPAPAAVDLSGKADKDADAVSGNVAVFDADGNPVDGGTALSDLLTESDINDYTADEIAALLS